MKFRITKHWLSRLFIDNCNNCWLNHLIGYNYSTVNHCNDRPPPLQLINLTEKNSQHNISICHWSSMCMWLWKFPPSAILFVIINIWILWCCLWSLSVQTGLLKRNSPPPIQVGFAFVFLITTITRCNTIENHVQHVRVPASACLYRYSLLSCTRHLTNAMYDDGDRNTIWSTAALCLPLCDALSYHPSECTDDSTTSPTRN